MVGPHGAFQQDQVAGAQEFVQEPVQRMGLMDDAGRMLPEARRDASRLLSFAGSA